MNNKLTTGNAARDSENFRQWFVGDIESWTKGVPGAFSRDRASLRNNQDLELKWGTHPKGEKRPGSWASPSKKQAISILIQGSFVISFRDPLNHDSIEEVPLRELGDYVIWNEELEHNWRAENDSLVLTVRWLPNRS